MASHRHTITAAIIVSVVQHFAEASTITDMNASPYAIDRQSIDLNFFIILYASFELII